jgi:hypothetical protein
MKRICQVGLLGIGLLSITMVTGCAFGDRHAALQYKKCADIKNCANLAETKNVAVVKFKDIRQTKEIGEVKNGWGLKTASVYAQEEDLGGWVANAFVKELEQRGYSVQKFGDVAPPGSELVLSGSLVECYTKLTFFGGAESVVRVSVQFNRQGNAILMKEYQGKVKAPIAFAMADEYGNAVEEALRDVMRQTVPDIIKESAE